MRGYLVASSEKQGAKISYIWDVTDAQGARVTRVSGEEIISTRAGSDPWSAVDAAAIRSIAGKTTSQLAACVPRGRGSSTAVATAPPSSGPSSGVAPSRAGSTTPAAATAPAATPVSSKPRACSFSPSPARPATGRDP